MSTSLQDCGVTGQHGPDRLLFTSVMPISTGSIQLYQNRLAIGSTLSWPARAFQIQPATSNSAHLAHESRILHIRL